MVIANKDVYDGRARGLSTASKAIVVSMDYRLAPEAKFPAACDDILAAYKFVAMNAAAMKGDPQRLALVGESAGGNYGLGEGQALEQAMIGWFVDKIIAHPAD